jgi:hypothetical protein
VLLGNFRKVDLVDWNALHSAPEKLVHLIVRLTLLVALQYINDSTLIIEQCCSSCFKMFALKVFLTQ